MFVYKFGTIAAALLAMSLLTANWIDAADAKAVHAESSAEGGDTRPVSEQAEERLYFSRDGKPFAGIIQNEYGDPVKLDDKTGSCLRLKVWKPGCVLRAFDMTGNPCGEATLTKGPNGEFCTLVLRDAPEFTPHNPDADSSPFWHKLHDGAVYDWIVVIGAGSLAIIPDIVAFARRRKKSAERALTTTDNGPIRP